MLRLGEEMLLEEKEPKYAVADNVHFHFFGASWDMARESHYKIQAMYFVW
jgi:hypothetical protein